MKLCVIGNKSDLINSNNHKFIKCSDVSTLLKSENITKCKIVLIQADCRDVVENDNLRTILIKLNHIFTELCVNVIVAISFKIGSMKYINNVYDDCSMFNALRIVFISHVRNNDKDKWVMEIRKLEIVSFESLTQNLIPFPIKNARSDSSTTSGSETWKVALQNNRIDENHSNMLSTDKIKKNIERMFHLLHYDLEITHKNIAYVPQYGLRCISKYSRNVAFVKKKHIDKIKMDEIMNFTERSKLINIIEQMNVFP